MLLAPAAAACGGSNDASRGDAKERLRANVADVAGRLDEARSRATTPPEPQTVREVVSSQSRTIVVAGARRTPNGEVSIDAALHERAESGGGLAYESTGLRMCVRFVVPPTRTDPVRTANIRCPAGLPAFVDGVGNIDESVRYRR